uniref:Uncharacterized protein n=1 Tax=Oryza glumipatula TaxID=40148 RepID=A0A0E0BMI5_9ORYZ
MEGATKWINAGANCCSDGDGLIWHEGGTTPTRDSGGAAVSFQQEESISANAHLLPCRHHLDLTVEVWALCCQPPSTNAALATDVTVVLMKIAATSQG